MDHQCPNVGRPESAAAVEEDANGCGRDGSTPEKQAAQIMAIYPVIKGQRFNQKNVIPPRSSISDSASRPTDLHNHQEPQSGDLIDFGDDKSPVSEQNKPPLDASHKSTAEIQAMLASTGTRAKDSPLVDFHDDMKKTLPNSKEADSDDEFVDAHEG